MKKHPLSGAIERARQLRRDMTQAERKMWSLLKMGDLAEWRFRRQVPLGPFIADFASHRARLIIEVDGGQHDLDSTQETGRTAFLNAEGYRVIRLWNNEVLANAEGVYQTIAAELEGMRISSHPPSSAPR